MATGIVAFILVNVLRVPDFELVTKYISSQNQTSSEKYGRLEFQIENKKRYIGFAKEEISFFLTIPSNFLEDKEFFWVDPNVGNQRFYFNESEIQRLTIGEIDYFLLQGVVKLPVQPRSATVFLKIKGSFESLSYGPVYYSFNTPFGSFPSFFDNRNDVRLSEMTRFPSHMIYIDDEIHKKDEN